MFVTKKSLSRRTVLRGISGVIALPLLDAMVPAFATPTQSQAASQLRFGATYVPHGALPELWHPKEVGRDFTFTEPMKALEPFRQNLITVSGLLASGEPRPHAGASGGWLNGVGARAAGDAALSYKTLDQFIVDKIGGETPLPSMEVGTEDMGTNAGSSDSYSCVYYNAMSWRTETEPRCVEINPRLIFERMYGETGSAQQRLEKLRYKMSVLDSVTDEANRLSRQLGDADRRTLSAYLENVRQVESHLQKVMKQGDKDLQAPPIPAGIPDSLEEHLTLTYDLLHLALQGDVTRVFTFLVNMECTNRGYGFIGVPESFHAVSHHGGIPDLKDKYMKVVTWHVNQYAKFVQKLKDTPDGDGTLFDHSLLFYGSGMGNANAHDPFMPPTIALGGANGRLVGNKHIAVENKLPAANFLLTLAQLCDVDLQKIGPSTGPIAI